MSTLIYNNYANSSCFVEETIRVIRACHEKKGLAGLDYLTYITAHILRHEDQTSHEYWKCNQSLLNLDERWYSLLNDSNRKNLGTYLSNISPTLSLYKSDNVRLLVNRAPAGNDVFYTFVNSLMQNVFSDSFQRFFAEAIFNRQVLVNRIENRPVTTLKSNIDKNVTVEDEVVVIETRPNYGHFLTDYLSLYLLLQHNPDLRHLKVLTYRLMDVQLEILKAYDFDTSRLIQFDIEPGRGVCIGLRRAYIYNRINPTFGARYIQNYLPNTKHNDNNDLVFLSRGKFKFSRIANQSDVEDTLARRKFTTLYTHELTTTEVISRIRNAKIIVTTMGAQIVNALFAVEAIVILIFPVQPRINELMDLANDKALCHGLSCFKNLRILRCPVQHVEQARAVLDLPSVVEISQLEQLIDASMAEL